MSVLAAALAALVVWCVMPDSVSRGLARRRLAARPRRREGRHPPRLRAPTAWAIAVLSLAAPAALTGWWWLLLASPAAAPALRRWWPREDAGRRASVAAGLPLALELLAACVRAGLPLRAAAAVVAPCVAPAVGQPLARVVASVRVGGDEAEAWRELAADPTLAAVARDLARACGSGTAVAAALERHVVSSRADHQAHILERARTVGVRSVWPLMACFLPAFLLLGVVPVVAGVLVRLLG